MNVRAALCAASVGVLSFIAGQSANGAVLATYQFGVLGQETTSESSPAFGPTSTFAGVSATPVTDPIGTVGIEISSAATTPTSAPYLRLDPQGNSTSAADAVQNNKYFQFSIKSTASDLLTVTHLDFLVARGGAGTPRGYVVRSSADNFAANIAAADVGTVRPNWTTVSLPLSGSGFTNLPSSSPLIFRVYSYSPAGGSSVDYDNITVSGVVPEPTSLAALTLSAAGLLSRRRTTAVI